MGIMEIGSKWLDHFSVEELDSVVTHLIAIKTATADTNTNMLYGGMPEADYHRLKLHYRIEYFTTPYDERPNLGTMVETLNLLYSRLEPFVKWNVKTKRGLK